ncbi:MAG: hypothetical protein HQL97_00395 [Magnetococcales bacterium]|nr:hypothetical protein [Magnetococcales bacterium]
MSDEYGVSGLSSIGANLVTFAGGIGTGALLVMRWFTKQRDKILLEVAALRTKVDNHVVAMDKAHSENGNRFIKLEAHVENSERRLTELVDMTKELTRENRKQMEILVNLAGQGKK